MTLLVVSPGVAFSTADVEAGLLDGLEAAGVDVVRYRLTERIAHSRRWLFYAWRRAARHRDLAKPTTADVFFRAGIDALWVALKHEVDAVVIVSAMFLHPDVVILMRRAGLRVVALFTESPYDLPQELTVAALLNGCWTTERTSADAFRRVCPNVGYVPHGWHSKRHQPGPQPGDDALPAHDVVFVGSGFPERVAWLSAIDWRGIDLGLYGHWELSAGHPLLPYVRSSTIDNARTSALYRRAKLALNLYRDAPGAESLNPRAYELAACGVPSVSTYRAEVPEVFGTLVPTVRTPAEAETAIHTLLADDAQRAAIAAQLPDVVATDSWRERARGLVADVRALCHPNHDPIGEHAHA